MRTVLSTGGMTRRAAVAFALAALVGCSGDLSPLEEAIEVRDLGLETLEIRPPLGSRIQDDVMYLNPGERIPFTLEGGGQGATTVDLGDAERRWRVSDGRFGSIDGNGVLTGIADGGPFTVRVNIGDVVAQGFPVQVRNAALESITGVERAEREPESELLDPCVPATYIAIGAFNDGTERRLSSVEWDVVEGRGARFAPTGDGGVLLTGTTPGEVLVLAESAGIGRRIPVTVDASLRGLEIGPEGTLSRMVGNTLELSATGAYGVEGGALEEIDVTQSVDWDVPSGTGFATVTTGDDTRGVVRAVSAGTAQVRARCGTTDEAVEAQRAFSAFGTDTSTDVDDPDALVFGTTLNDTLLEDGDTLVLSRDEVFTGDGSVQLSVEQDGVDVTDRVTWVLSQSGVTTTGTPDGFGVQVSAGQLETAGTAAGRFTPGDVGTVRVRATLDDESDESDESSTLTIIVDP